MSVSGESLFTLNGTFACEIIERRILTEGNLKLGLPKRLAPRMYIHHRDVCMVEMVDKHDSLNPPSLCETTVITTLLYMLLLFRTLTCINRPLSQ